MMKLPRFCGRYGVGIQDDNEVSSVLDIYKLIYYDVEDVMERKCRFVSFAVLIVQVREYNE